MTDDSRNEHAAALSALGASKGGQARAEKLSREHRVAIASLGAEARWGVLPRATHVGVLEIGGVEIPCAVLEDERRVLTERGVSRALGRKHGGKDWVRREGDERGGKLPIFLGAKNLKPFIGDDLRAVVSEPIRYRDPRSGKIAHGIEAAVIPQICDVWLKGRAAAALKDSQLRIAQQAEILMRGLAHVGIIALVDEATGYQDARSQNALAKILEAFVAKELRPWVKTFPPDFYKEMFRLRKIPYNASPKRPQYIGTLTNDLVYRRLAPGVLAKLQEKNPKNERGRRKHKHFQWLTDEIGDPKLREHLASVTTIMKLSDTWERFIDSIDRIHPAVGKNMRLF